jgi:hypothetical protein
MYISNEESSSKNVLSMPVTIETDCNLRESLKKKILTKAASVDRGFGSDKNDRNDILALIDQLSILSPIKNATQGLYPFNASNVDCPIAGTWKLVFTTAFDVLTLSGNPFTLLQGIYQVIFSDGSSVNVIDFAPRIQAIFPPQLIGKGSTIRAKVLINARARSKDRVGLTFIGASAVPMSFANIDISDKVPKLTFKFPRLDMFGMDSIGASIESRNSSPGYFDVLYLDEDCLIIQQNEPGGIFVNFRSDLTITIA